MKRHDCKHTAHILPVLVTAAVCATSLNSCVIDELFHTPHPSEGAVVVTADFSARSASCPVPSAYILAVGDEECTAFPQIPHCHPKLFAPGEYALTAWNSCEGMTRGNEMEVGRSTETDPETGETAENNNTGTDKTDGSGSGAAMLIRVSGAAKGGIEARPGYLFTARQQITVPQDDTLRVEIPMSQRCRDLHFSLTLTEGNPELVKSVTARLDGIAGAFDLVTQKTAGEPASTVFAFTRSGDKITADVRLLGVLGPEQKLELSVTFTDRPETEVQTTEIDLTEALATFGGNMTEGFEITGTLATPVGADASATITGWNDVEGDSADAI